MPGPGQHYPKPVFDLVEGHGHPVNQGSAPRRLHEDAAPHGSCGEPPVRTDVEPQCATLTWHEPALRLEEHTCRRGIDEQGVASAAKPEHRVTGQPERGEPRPRPAVARRCLVT